MVTLTVCELYSLPREALLSLAQAWPEVAQELKMNTCATLPETPGEYPES